MQLGDESKSAREEITLAAARDPIWFFDTFLWTFNPKDHPDAPERPFISYPFQERAQRKVDAAIGKHSLVVPKTRAVGGTYIILATLFHRWRFRRMQTFLLASAKEDRVDEFDDPDCLFWKLDHFLRCLPIWLRPPIDRVKLRLVNLETESVFNGETTNKDLGRGGRRTAVLADETAAMPKSDKIINSLSQVTNTNIFLSTPQGAFGGFYKMYEQYSLKCPERVLRLHWTEHPVYSQGLYYDSAGKARSPWYDEQCLSAPGPRTIAQELDIDFVAAGGAFFEAVLLERLLGAQGTIRNPHSRGELSFDDNGDETRWIPGSPGRMLLWCPVGQDGRPPAGKYGAGADIATGKGGEMSSQSTLAIGDLETGEKVVEFKTPNMTPTNFARYAVSACRWFHDAKLIWGSQGPGSDFGKTVKDCRYGNVWHRPGDTRKTGFVETSESKLSLFGSYQDALNKGRFVNRSKEAIEECRQFIFANGTVEHSRAIQGDVDPENKGKLHGDIVVADALLNHLLPVAKPTPASEFRGNWQDYPGELPFGSPAWKMREYITRKNKSPFYSLSK